MDDMEKVYNGATNPLFLFAITACIILDVFPQVVSFLDVVLSLRRSTNRSQVEQNAGKQNGKKEKKVQGSGSTIELSYKQSLITRWYLLNGLIIHFMMDGISGNYNLFPMMHESYLKLDERFVYPLSASGVIATLTMHLELLTMVPLCLIVYYGYRCHALASIKINKTENFAIYPSWVYCLEIIIAILQIVGTWFYAGAEILHIVFGTGLESVPVDWKLEFSKDHIIFFWFAFVAIPPVWVFVPLYMIKRAIGDLDQCRNVKID